MSKDREQSNLQVTTKFRLMDNGFGQYGTVMSMEAEEGLRDLPTMPEEDILFFRPVHWLIQFMWNYRFYYPLLKFFHMRKINPLEFILALVRKARDPSTPAPVRTIFERFHKDACEEWFDSREELFAHYSQPSVFQALKSGEFGKMNGKYIFHVLMEAKQFFDEYVLSVANVFFANNGSDKAILRDLVQYSQKRVIDFEKGIENVPAEKFLSLDVDVRAWEEANFSDDLADWKKEGRVHYRLDLPEEQRDALRLLMRQYDHPNKNVVLRKMTEFMDIRDLFYKVTPVVSRVEGKGVGHD